VHWSMPALSVVVPVMLTWGFFCSVVMILSGSSDETSGAGTLLRQFYFMMLAAGILLIVTGSRREKPSAMIFWAGLAVTFTFVLLWIFQGKRSPSLIGLLATSCAYYGPRFKRPPVAVLVVLAVVGSLVVAVSLAWRNQRSYERNASGFVQFLADFEPSTALVNLNLAEKENPKAHLKEFRSKETEEYGGFLLMFSTVPERSEYDYGASYLRLFTTFIPRIVWADKPIPGRDKWIAAWMAGSTAQRRARGHRHSAQFPGHPPARQLRILPPIPVDMLGPGLVGPDLLQCLAHDRQRRPLRLVLLHLRLLDHARDGLSLGRQPLL